MPANARLPFGTILAVAMTGALAAGCSSTDDLHNYFGHSDDVVVDAGDAVATNKVAHTIDPWAPHSERNDIRQSGARTAIAVRRYQTDKVKKPGGNGNGKGGFSINGHEGDAGVDK
jgi:hypothetical protein